MDLAKVSIIVTAYLKESQAYLDNCIASIKNLDYPKELIETIIVTPSWYQPEYENCRRVVPCYGAYHNPVAVNFGMNAASKDSKYLLLINDDVILTRNCLKHMVWAAGDNDVCMGAISNCDNGGQYILQMPFGLMNRQYRIDQIKDQITDMMNTDSLYSSGIIFPHTLFLYANLFPRKVWEKVGGFDEELKTGFDDTDWCMRAKQHRVRLAISLDALAWHCSGASADITMGKLNSEIRKENAEYFKRKWGTA